MTYQTGQRPRKSGLASVWIILAIGGAFGLHAFAAPAPNAPGAGKLQPLELRAGDIPTISIANLLADKPVAFRVGQRYVIQLDGPITPERRDQLQQAGIVPGPYLPQNSYVVELAGVSPDAFDALPFVGWLAEYADEWKLDPEIGRRLTPFQTDERITLAGEGKLRLAMTLFPGATLDGIQADLDALGAVIQHSANVGGQEVVTLDLSPDRVAGLTTFADVQFVEEAGEVNLRNSTVRWIAQSNVSGVTPVHSSGVTGVGQIVGIMDGRVRIDHCSFVDTVPPGPLHRKIAAYNAGAGTDSHGTHVAGTAVGDAGNSTDTRGMAYGGKFTFADIPSFTETAMNNALTLHHNQGARVHTNSWGDDGTTSYNGLCRGIDVFSHNNEDDLVLFAVTNLGTLKNPENAKNLLAVGATSDTPGQANHCSGGNGPTSDGRRKPEVYLPGCGILSASSGSSCGTVGSSGTSMACPAVAGTAMLVRQYYVDGYYPTGAPSAPDSINPSGALVKATLINSSVDMLGVAGYPSNREGWGRILLGDTLYFPGDTRKFVVLDDVRNANGLSTSDIQEYTISVPDGMGPLKVTLVWTDPPAASGTFNVAINDLNLEVVSPTASLYLGNFFSGGFSATGGTADTKNNVEQVHIAAPVSGPWTIRVVATTVAVGTQGFALIASGADPSATCTDGLLNQGEDRIDCGGPCDPCECSSDDDCTDGAYCNGTESCDLFGDCKGGQGPCANPATPFCNEAEDRCDECVVDTDCDDSIACTADTCSGIIPTCANTQLIIVFGDTDGSGLVEITDLLCTLAEYAVPGTCPLGDVFPCVPDGQTELSDVVAMLDAYNGNGPCPDQCPP